MEFSALNGVHPMIEEYPRHRVSALSRTGCAFRHWRRPLRLHLCCGDYGESLRSQLVQLLIFGLIASGIVVSAQRIRNATILPSFTAVRFPQDSQVPTLADGQHSLKGGETQNYRIKLSAGQFLAAVVEQVGIDLVVTIFAPDGSQIAVTDSPNDRWGTEPVLLIAKASGDYRVEIKSPNARAEAGRYEIRMQAVREATPSDRAYVAAQRTFEEAQKLRSQPTATAKHAAIEKYKEAQSGFKAAGDSYRLALVLQMTGLAHLQLNEFRVALPYLSEAISLAQSVKDPRLEASIETVIGGVHDVLGNVIESRQHYERAITLARQSKSTQAEGSALNNIGKLYNDVGDYQNALDFYLQSLPLFLPQSNQRAITLNNIGVSYTNLGEFEKSIDYLQQALAIMRNGPDRNAESYTLSNIGNAFKTAGNYQEALNYFGQARAIQQKTGNRAQEAETLDLTGVVYSRLGQAEKALEFHQQALEIQRATQNIRREAISLTNIGHVYNLLSRPEKALEHIDKALSIFRNIGDLNNAGAALEARARAEQIRGDLVASRKNIEESLSLIETVRARSGSQQLRASYLASREKAYEFYVDLLMQLDAKEPGKGHGAEALQASERSRARSFMELLNEAHVDVREGVSADLIKRERELNQLLNAKAQREIQLTARKGNQQEINALDKEISALEDEYQQLQVAIRKASPAYAALTQPQALNLDQIQKQLDRNTLLLEYSLGDDHSYLWLVASDSLRTYELPKRPELQTVAKQVYDSLTARSVIKSLETPMQRQKRIADADAQFQQAAAQLSKMILEPAKADLGTKRLALVADGVLQYIPFAALNDPNSAEPLVIQHELISLPSASTLAVQRRNLANRKPAPNTVAVIADPVFATNDARFAKKVNIRQQKTGEAVDTRLLEHLAETGQLTIRRLPFTRQEADQILAVAPAGSNLKAVDFRANRSLAMSDELSKFRYVHFATHGYLDSARPDLSAIVLSLVDQNGNAQDGFLRSHDIFNLKLPAELLVLSACETGLGKDVKGEGLVGLTRGFMYAGARRVVVSLWNVNDKATAELMARFYRGMLRENKTPAAALRTAQLEMSQQKQWQSPYYWAAFVLQGEWK
jgi:CHAT domain-containing protein/tetratricopeptide (TPR) repeat protein